MVQLLQKLSIRATNGPDKLLKVVKGPVTKYFPLNCRRIGLSVRAPSLQPLHEYVKGLDDGTPVVFCVGEASGAGRLQAWMQQHLQAHQIILGWHPGGTAGC